MMEEFLKSKVEEIAFSEVEMTDSLWASGILDSITIVELAVEVESEYGISIPLEEITEDRFETLALLQKYITEKVNQK